MHRRPHALRQAPVIRPGPHTSGQPLQIPPNGLRPLFQLPSLSGHSLPQDLQLPKRPRRLAA
ncbi:MAG: hypothetical protein ABI073_03200, partial [Luteolibacter sp.]